MRFMILVKATRESEAGEMPSEQMLTAMGNFNEELVKAGVLLAGEGGGTLHPGRYVQQGSQPLANPYHKLADRMGVAGLPRFGDSTGRLADV